MNDSAEEHLAQAVRHVREGEQRIARQMMIVDTLEKDDHPKAAEQAKQVLDVLRRSLELAREHLRIEQDMHGTPSAPRPAEPARDAVPEEQGSRPRDHPTA
ncbi:conserved protein of unknown function [Rhodovastum atsumiense]|uniref:Uncharacterized protein n=1 Tax=Rhodovastum atsumiense TaxID=504468 RepID=A0A5M6ISW5_9PROT|nr:hypothetical protein [Rhodovastum atsumiense]KAA5611410.1 hypothetical protein F1189_14850 [Rhodovastum atsumiense]CAH2603573.1 conserved protein of unknown function [Rhodovastum atsumiense]